MAARRLIAAALAAGLLAPAAGAQECRIALSLGLDVSSSVDAGEYRLLTGGLAAALEAPEVAAAFFAAPGRFVALQVFEWSGARQQVVRLEWTDVTTPETLAAAAARLRYLERSFAEYPTALGAALGFGATQLARGPACARRTLDISGDGANNHGYAPPTAYKVFDFEGVTVNGLVIGESAATLARYFRTFVIHGPGAFVETADDYADFERAMRRKLVRELTEAQLSGTAPARALR